MAASAAACSCVLPLPLVEAPGVHLKQNEIEIL